MVNDDQNRLLERLSGAVDEQCSDEELEQLLAEVESSDVLKDQWDHFHLIGDLIRSSDMADFTSFNCVSAVSSAIALESPPVSDQPKSATVLQFGRTKRMLQTVRQVGSWASVAAAIGFVSWTVGTLGRSDDLSLALSPQTIGASKVVSAQPPSDWQELLQYHQVASQVSTINPTSSPIVRANLNQVNVVVDNDLNSSTQASDSMEWMRLWDQSVNATVQKNNRHR